jgi:hypothetical protein
MTGKPDELWLKMTRKRLDTMKVGDTFISMTGARYRITGWYKDREGDCPHAEDLKTGERTMFAGCAEGVPLPLSPTALNVARGGSPGFCREEYDTKDEMRARVQQLNSSRDCNGVQRYSIAYTRDEPNPVTGKWTILY